MKFFQRYVAYLKDNPERYWFKRHLYGWGWTPATWEGWLVTINYLGLTLAFAVTVDGTSPTREVWFTFVLPIFLLAITFIKIAYTTGERPAWRWGFPTSQTDSTQDKILDPRK